MRSATLMVVVTVMMLGTAPLASAECAWVLWQKDVERKDWGVLAGFESRTQCIQDGHSFVARMEALMNQAYAKEPPQPPMTISVEKHPGGYTMSMKLTQEGLVAPYLEFVCLPDTIDPREKK